LPNAGRKGAIRMRASRHNRAEFLGG
jgi:hypothetical protein